MTAKTDKKNTPNESVHAPQITRFIIVHGDKGGVGKSFVAQAIANDLSANSNSVAVIDADTQNPDVSRMFQNSMPCALANIRNENGWMDVMDFVAKHPGYTFVMNTPAGIGEYMKHELIQFYNFLKAQEMPVEMELWWVMNANHDSVNLFSKAHELYGPHFSKVRVVCNLHFTNGERDGFLLWNESPLRIKIEKTHGPTIYFPGLHIRVVSKIIDPSKVMPFSHAVDASAGEEVDLAPAERWKLQAWLQTINDLFKPAFVQHAAVAP